MSEASDGSSGPVEEQAGSAPDAGPEQPHPFAGWPQPTPPGGWPPPGAPAPAPKPGVIPLRPLGVGEIMDGAIAAVRRYPALMLGVSVIVVGIGQALNFVLQRAVLQNASGLVNSGRRPTAVILETFGDLSVNFVITIVVTSLAQVLLTGFLTVVVGQAVLGRPVSFGEAWSRLRPRLLPLLALTVLYALLVFAGTLLLIVPGVWLWVLYALATPVLVLESAPITMAFRRSRELVRGMWWRTFGILLLGSLLATIAAGIIGLPFSVAGSLLSASTGNILPTTTALLLTSIGATISGTITYPVVASVRVLLYFDQRMRREGWDIELARQVGAPTPGPPYPGPAQPPASW
jgi:hypothetical protein